MVVGVHVLDVKRHARVPTMAVHWAVEGQSDCFRIRGRGVPSDRPAALRPSHESQAINVVALEVTDGRCAQSVLRNEVWIECQSRRRKASGGGPEHRFTMTNCSASAGHLEERLGLRIPKVRPGSPAPSQAKPQIPDHQLMEHAAGHR
jgi:hypothetical protein